MIHRAWHPVLLGVLAVFLAALPARSETVGRSKADRVSIRSRPGLQGEVVARLAKGQEVQVLGEVTLAKPGTNEAPAWFRVALPPGTPAWVDMEHVDAATKAVKADVLVVRAGASWDYGAVGRAKKGTVLQARGEPKSGWLEIEAPPGSFGFVQASFLETGAAPVAPLAAVAAAPAAKPAPAPPKAPVPAPAAAPASAPATALVPIAPAAGASRQAAPSPAPQTPVKAAVPAPAPAAPLETRTVGEPTPQATRVVDEPAPAAAPASKPVPAGKRPPRAAAAKKPAKAAPAPAAAPVGTAAVAAPAVVAPVPAVTEAGTASTPPPPAGLEGSEARRVRREGLVIRPFNIQAPSYYGLQARDSGKMVNFLFSTRAEPINWREYRGRVVILTGREYLDSRYYWQKIPLLDVETIEAVR